MPRKVPGERRERPPWLLVEAREEEERVVDGHGEPHSYEERGRAHADVHHVARHGVPAPEGGPARARAQLAPSAAPAEASWRRGAGEGRRAHDQQRCPSDGADVEEDEVELAEVAQHDGEHLVIEN